MIPKELVAFINKNQNTVTTSTVQSLAKDFNVSFNDIIAKIK